MAVVVIIIAWVYFMPSPKELRGHSDTQGRVSFHIASLNSIALANHFGMMVMLIGMLGKISVWNVKE